MNLVENVLHYENILLLSRDVLIKTFGIMQWQKM